MTQPDEGGAVHYGTDRGTGDDAFSAPTSHYSVGSVGYAQPSGEQQDSAVDTSERQVVSIDEGDDDFGPATISGRGYGSDGADGTGGTAAAAGAATSAYAADTATHSDATPDTHATTAYDHPGQYGLSGSAVTSSYGSYAGAPATAAPSTSATATTERPAEAGATTGTSRTAARARGPRRASLQLRHINPWTVLKFSCVLAIALFFVWLIIVGVLFGILDAAGVVGKINETATTINGPGSKSPITVGVVFGGAALVGVVNVILFIALSTVGSIIYNLCADLVGGVEVTLSET
jgi:hypothetical protein